MSYRDITVHSLFTDYYLATGVTITSAPVDLGAAAANGFFSLQVHIQGSGTSVVAAYLLSNDGFNYVHSTNGDTISTSFHHMCGIAKDGRDLISFSPTMAARMKLQFWLSTGTGSTITAKLAIM